MGLWRYGRKMKLKVIRGRYHQSIVWELLPAKIDNYWFIYWLSIAYRFIDYWFIIDLLISYSLLTDYFFIHFWLIIDWLIIDLLIYRSTNLIRLRQHSKQILKRVRFWNRLILANVLDKLVDILELFQHNRHILRTTRCEKLHLGVFSGGGLLQKWIWKNLKKKSFSWNFFEKFTTFWKFFENLMNNWIILKKYFNREKFF